MTEDIKVKSVTVFWPKGRVEDYDDIVGMEVDQVLGFPRLSILSSKGVTDNINLNSVESWTVEMVYVQ